MSYAHANTLLYAALCGSLCFVIAFMYRRNGAKYKFVPSLVAFAIAAKAGSEWLEVMGTILLYGHWPRIPVAMTVALSALVAITAWHKGNIARMLGHLNILRSTTRQH